MGLTVRLSTGVISPSNHMAACVQQHQHPQTAHHFVERLPHKVELQVNLGSILYGLCPKGLCTATALVKVQCTAANLARVRCCNLLQTQYNHYIVMASVAYCQHDISRVCDSQQACLLQCRISTTNARWPALHNEKAWLGKARRPGPCTSDTVWLVAILYHWCRVSSTHCIHHAQHMTVHDDCGSGYCFVIVFVPASHTE